MRSSFPAPEGMFLFKGRSVLSTLISKVTMQVVVVGGL